MKNITKLFAISLAGALLTSTFNAQAENLRLGHVTPPSHIWHKVSERFADNLGRETGGEDSIRLFPLGKLGGDTQMIDLLQSGALQLAVLTAGSLSNRAESFNAWFLPYEFNNVSDAAGLCHSAP